MRPFNPGESVFTGITYGIVYAGLIFVGLRVGGEPGRGDGRAQAQHPARDLLQRGGGSRLLRRPRVGAAAGLRPQRRRAAQELPAALRRDRQPRLRRRHVRRDRAVAGRDRHRGGRPGHGTGTTRGIFALARDGTCRGRWRPCIPRYKTPYVAATAVAVAADRRRADRAHLDGRSGAGHADRPARALVPDLPVRRHDRGVPALHRLPADRAHGVQGAARREPRRASRSRASSAGATSVAALYGVVHKAPSIYWFDKIWWLALIWIVIGIGVVLVAKSRGNLESHAPVDSRLAARGSGAHRGRPDPRAADFSRRSASPPARCAGRRRRGRRSARTRRPCVRGGRRPGRSRPPGCPASTVSVAPSCQLSRPPRSAGLPEVAAGRRAAPARSGRPRRPRPAARRRRPRRSRADARAATGRAPPPRAIQSLELALDERPVAVLVGAVGQVLDVALERARGRVGDEPLAARDDRRHAVARREVGVARAHAPSARAGARTASSTTPSSRSR